MMSFLTKLFFLVFVSTLASMSSCHKNQVTTPVIEKVLIIKARGVQCKPAEYESVTEARNELIDNGIEVYSSRQENFVVCEACEVCPTSEHYIMSIKVDDINKAKELGWESYDNQ